MPELELKNVILALLSGISLLYFQAKDMNPFHLFILHFFSSLLKKIETKVVK